AIDQLPEVRLDEVTVTDVDDEPDAADDPAVLANLPRPHEEVLLLAGAALDALLQLVVTPGCAGLERRDDRRDEPVPPCGSGGLAAVARGSPDRAPGRICEEGPHRRVPGKRAGLELEPPPDNPQRLEGERANLAGGVRRSARVGILDAPKARLPP